MDNNNNILNERYDHGNFRIEVRTFPAKIQDTEIEFSELTDFKMGVSEAPKNDFDFLGNDDEELATFTADFGL